MASFRTEYQKVSDALRDAILRGDFSPGERLPQRKLAEQFGTTTITVREALRTLCSEGLVEIEPKWGATVVELSPQKLEGQYIVREALEGMAARLASIRMSDAQRAMLLEKADECDRLLPSDELELHEKVELHYSLHERIAGGSGCDELVEAIRRLNVFSLLLLNAYHDCISADPPGWHGTLAVAVAGPDPDEAERVMRSHIRHGLEYELRKIRNPEMDGE